MSGFRKFRTTTQRRRRSVEAVELGYLPGRVTQAAPGSPSLIADSHPSAAVHEVQAAGPVATIELPASQEAMEIGPAPIAWLKRRKTETDN